MHLPPADPAPAALSTTARLCCKALRDLIDQEVTEIEIRIYNLEPGTLHFIALHGSWLDRWPKCTKLELSSFDEGMLTAPFARVPAEACRRIRELVVRCMEADSSLTTDTLIGLVPRMPELTQLTLLVKAPADILPRAMVASALSLLPNLTSLTVADWGYLPLIPEGLAAQLTRLEVNLDPQGQDRLQALRLPPSMPAGFRALRELVLRADGEDAFTHAQLAGFLDALPPTVQRLSVGPVKGPYIIQFDFTLSGGVLESVEVCGELIPSRELSVALATYLLPSRALGRRLGLLTVANLSVSPTPAAAGPTPTPDPAAEFLACCDRVNVRSLHSGGDIEACLSVMRLYGIPEQLLWEVGSWGGTSSLRLRGARAPAAAAGSTGGAVLAPPAKALTASAVVERAVRQAVAFPSEHRSRWLVLRGPLLRGLSEAPEALDAWLRRVRTEAGEGTDPFFPPCYTLLHTEQAVVLRCTSAEAVAAAAQRLGAAFGPGMLEVRVLRYSWDYTVAEVLQAWWDGEAEGRGGGAAGSGEAAGGSGSGGRRGAGGAGSELERVRCLLGAWEGVQALAPERMLGRLRA
ncbi:hypothetical protein HYH03_017959 [Edaphochlamys debaryana]|uniref:Uncharacterized protein n=1 Tax=Edaphochlamys debaryana TaxID=47281 RepID=A0A835XEQ4_9CHLO|nr:hypothetical protein HYH03_017959 [Edaphochlamys debaryana]|eukprot:KAG2483167.1 hypothetical protein HYH03_017959 [Edaphochlamys debaryana]